MAITSIANYGYSSNQLKSVQSFQTDWIAWLYLSSALIHISNRKYEELMKLPGQIGDTVTFVRAPQKRVVEGSLAVNYTQTNQEYLTLAIDKKATIGFNFTQLEEYFNVGKTDWAEVAKEACAIEVGMNLEAKLGLEILNTYRFYGSWSVANGVSTISPTNSILQLSEAMAEFKAYGSSSIDLYGVLPHDMYPQITASGLKEFALNRNNSLSDYSWDKATYAGCEWTEAISTLPIHEAGIAGKTGTELTVQSVVVDSAGLCTQIVCSGLGTTTGAIKKNDVMVFVDGVSGLSNIRYLTYGGHLPSSAKVQMRAIADADSASDVLTITISEPLCWDPTSNKYNVTTPVVPGMKISVAPDHRAGVILSGKCLYFAMPPAIQKVKPYTGSTITDKDTGLSMTMIEGMALNDPNLSYMYHIPYVYGTSIEPRNAMRFLCPVTP